MHIIETHVKPAREILSHIAFAILFGTQECELILWETAPCWRTRDTAMPLPPGIKTKDLQHFNFRVGRKQFSRVRGKAAPA
jgi:hypothetical protein